jgi:hypothetical protein
LLDRQLVQRHETGAKQGLPLDTGRAAEEMSRRSGTPLPKILSDAQVRQYQA